MKAYTHWLALYRRTICVLHLVRDVETKPCCPCLPSGALKELNFNPPVTCSLHPKTTFSLCIQPRSYFFLILLELIMLCDYFNCFSGRVRFSQRYETLTS